MIKEFYLLAKEDFDSLRRQAFFYGVVSGIAIVTVVREIAGWLR